MGDWLIDEDPALLDATLSLLESLDDSAGSAGSEKAASEDGSVATTEARPRRINVCRERRKQELHGLRDSAAQLESQLFTLQQRREAMLQPHFSGRAVLSTAPIWENMARRQFQARKQSEEYNARLRAKLDVQARAARDLFDAIELAVRRHASVVAKPRVCLPIDVSLRMSEEEQLKRVDENRGKWQWALSLWPKFQEGELQFVDFHVVESDGKSVTMDIYGSHVLPYPVETVAKLMWQIFHEDTIDTSDELDEGNSYVQEHRSVGNLIIAVFSSTSTMGGEVESSGSMHGKLVAKYDRLMNDTQHVFSQHWHYEMTGFGNELDGVCSEEDSWIRIADARDVGHPQMIGELTVIQDVRRMRLELSKDQPVDEKHVERVTNMFKKQIEGEVDWMTRMMENMLMTPPTGMDSHS